MSKIVVVDEQINILPFKQVLTWEAFQLFCADILYIINEGGDSRDYLSQGNKQDGIDVYTIKKGEQKKIVAQCKLTENLRPSQIDRIIDDFLNGSFASDTSEFILCTSADLGRQQYEKTTLPSAREKLRLSGIKLSIWDERGLSTLLRTNASGNIINIVLRNFGNEITSKFYGDVWTNSYLKKPQTNKVVYLISQDYIERTISSFHGKFEIYQSLFWSNWGKEEKQNLVRLYELTVQEPTRVILLSIAGFGKSEETNHLAGYFSNPKTAYFPIKFSLRNYLGESIQELLGMIHKDWESIPQENLLLIFDGIDEITNNNDKKFIQSLNAFIEIKPKINVLASSRFNAYNVKHEPLKGF